MLSARKFGCKFVIDILENETVVLRPAMHNYLFKMHLNKRAG